MAEHWPELSAALATQALEAADRMLRGLEMLVLRERLSAPEMQVLATPALRLQRCAKQVQQILRTQSGQVRLSHEKIDFALVVEAVLHDRRDEWMARGLTLRRFLQPIELLIDPTLGYSLCLAMVDWAQRFGEHLELRLELDPIQPCAVLTLRTHEGSQAADAERLLQDSIEWLLLRQLADTDGGIELQSRATEDGVELSARLRRVCAAIETKPADEPATPLSKAPTPPAPAQPEPPAKTGAVLVCSADPAVRRDTLALLQPMGLVTDAVASAVQALALLRERPVSLLIFDAEHPPADAPQLHQALAGNWAGLPVLRLVRLRATAHDEHGGDTAVMSEKMQVPIDALPIALAPAVRFALSHLV